MKKTTVNPFIFTVAFFVLGLIAICLLFYFPAQLAPQYAASGQVIQMVQPNATDQARDLAYSEVNTINAGANVVSARADQIRQIPFMVYLFCFSGIGFLVALAKRAWS